MNETDTVQEKHTLQERHTVQEGHDTNHVNMYTSSVPNITSDAQNTAPRYLQQIRKTPVSFTQNVLRHTRYVGEPIANEALINNEALAWKASMKEEIDTL